MDRRDVLESVAHQVNLVFMASLETLAHRDHQQIFHNGSISCLFTKGH